MNISKTYIDKCLDLANLHREYLRYVPFYESKVVPEMISKLDLTQFANSDNSILLTQKGKTDINLYKGTEKDTFWKAIENTITENEISDLEKQLNVTLPESYKEYLKYKHYYAIFWDLEIVLHPKPKNDWAQILININDETKEILDKGYFSIGKYSDYGMIALKLGSNKEEELEVVLFDFETGELSKKIAHNFADLLKNILALEQPKIKELKNWQKKMKIFNS